jgi:oxepin-CoA hydrolase/3-oxo-5,6-dehydrosuberyl-CoA semialdehyde dehydrogenase
MLKKLAFHLLEKKDIFYKVSWATGATKADSWVDIEGGIGNLFLMHLCEDNFRTYLII